MFLLIPKTATSEKAGGSGLRHGWCKIGRQERKIMWDATESTLMVERSIGPGSVAGDGEVRQASELDEGAVTFCCGPNNSICKVKLEVACRWAMHFDFPQTVLRTLYLSFEHQRRVQFEGCVAEPLQTTTAIFPGSKWSVLLLRTVMQEAMSEVLNVYPQLMMKVYVDGTTIHVWDKNRKTPEVL